MGKKGKQSSSTDDILNTLGDFTSKENWDKFFTIRGVEDAFEWYAEWPELSQPLLSLFAGAPSSPEILVPGCGNSRLSEHMYDAGFKSITNVDFSKIVISDMLKRNVRERPGMKWRVMDMTSMRFEDESFDAVLDKGGLDALMEPELGPKLGDQYLSEVRRLLKSGGKFICLTLAESHVLGLLFPKFRFGWKMAVHSIPQKPSNKPSLVTFMVVAEKEDFSTVLSPITSSLGHSRLNSGGGQAAGLFEALERENQIRNEYSSGSDILYSFQDLQLGAKGNLSKLNQGSRFQFTLGGEGKSRFCYSAILLDAKENSGSFSYHCGVFIVPKTRAHEWLFSSEEGQWMVVESSKAARLIMVILDHSHSSASMADIQADLSPLVKPLAPGIDAEEVQIPFMMASDGIKQRNNVHQVTSQLTGPIVVEDVVYENVDEDVARLLSSRDLTFRRLVFQRAENLVQSEALLVRNGALKNDQEQRRKSKSSSKSKKKGNHIQKNESGDQLQVYHDYLASSYHLGIVSGFVLIASQLENMVSSGRKVNTIVIGLGAGLLPLFLHRSMSFLLVEAVELDAVILDLATDYFGFSEDEYLKVRIADGIKFIGEVENQANCSSNGNSPKNEDNTRSKIDILIIDVDSADSSSGMTCPAADFVEEAFLLKVKNALSEQGLFVVNLVARSPTMKDMVVQRMKTVFAHLYSLQLEEDVNMVLFGLCCKDSIEPKSSPQSIRRLEKLLNLRHPVMSQSIVEGAKKIKCLK
ncbi:unnamed protein product [Linum trigynum]|uniref:Methyltransferase type 11 domain-containing protein n=1 Tax=Linum trigynum TaxID=586398 RepID=A0AAV2EEU7_9ROSI